MGFFQPVKGHRLNKQIDLPLDLAGAHEGQPRSDLGLPEVDCRLLQRLSMVHVHENLSA